MFFQDPMRRLHALGNALARLGQLRDHAGVHPVFVFRLRHDDLDVAEDLLVLLGEQAVDVVGMEVRNGDGAQLGQVDAGFLRVGGEMAECRVAGGQPVAGVEHHLAVADLDDGDGIGVRHLVVGQAGSLQRRLHVIDRGVLDEGRVVVAHQRPVQHLRDLDIAHLELVELQRLRIEGAGFDFVLG